MLHQYGFENCYWREVINFPENDENRNFREVHITQCSVIGYSLLFFLSSPICDHIFGEYDVIRYGYLFRCFDIVHGEDCFGTGYPGLSTLD